jgi:acetoin utilization deacetylase AcuC-like enzyme
MAVGGTLAVLEAILSGNAGSGFALVRPPGHHASATRASGFCLFNNIAIAAHRAQSLDIPRVMIVDFDVHHGNGTQDIFEHDSNVLYLSTHQAGIYPGTGFVSEIGFGEGSGTIVNVPLPPRAGDHAFEAITQSVILPIAKRFSPDILMVSAGFDAHWNDPLASLQLSTTGYAQLGRALLEIAKTHCEGRILYVLEGGYDPHDLWENVAAILFSLADSPTPEDRLGPAPFPETSIDDLMDNVRSIHKLTGA